MEERVIALEKKNFRGRCGVKQWEFTSKMDFHFTAVGERQVVEEEKMELQFALLREEKKAIMKRMEGRMNLEKGLGSSKRKVTNRGKRTMEEESIINWWMRSKRRILRAREK